MKFQTLASTPQFYVKDFKRTFKTSTGRPGAADAHACACARIRIRKWGPGLGQGAFGARPLAAGAKSRKVESFICDSND